MNEFIKDVNFEKCDPHMSCDICTKSCSCPSCSEPSADVDCCGRAKSANGTATLSEHQQKQLRLSLISFRQEWCKSANTSYLLVGEEICTGLVMELLRT